MDTYFSSNFYQSEIYLRSGKGEDSKYADAPIFLTLLRPRGKVEHCCYFPSLPRNNLCLFLYRYLRTK